MKRKSQPGIRQGTPACAEIYCTLTHASFSACFAAPACTVQTTTFIEYDCTNPDVETRPQAHRITSLLRRSRQHRVHSSDAGSLSLWTFLMDIAATLGNLWTFSIHRCGIQSLAAALRDEAAGMSEAPVMFTFPALIFSSKPPKKSVGYQHLSHSRCFLPSIVRNHHLNIAYATCPLPLQRT